MNKLIDKIEERMNSIYDKENDSFENKKDDLEHYLLGVIKNEIAEDSNKTIKKKDILNVLNNVKKIIKKS